MKQAGNLHKRKTKTSESIKYLIGNSIQTNKKPREQPPYQIMKQIISKWMMEQNHPSCVVTGNQQRGPWTSFADPNKGGQLLCF